ncbi:MAG: YceH family protein [Rhodoferax sp.]
MTDSFATPPSLWPLDAVQARVLGTLMEKARTVPDSYPLSLNALLLGCNQKTSREPVMELSEADVAQALESLREKNLVREVSASRVLRYEHNFQRGAGVFEQAAVLLGLLMLRGPQTAAELRQNGERWYRFADTSSVEGFLDELLERSADKGGPLVAKLPRAPGEREQRWAHLLCGAVEVATPVRPVSIQHHPGPTCPRLEKLEDQIAELQATVAMLCRELGVSPPGQSQ